MGRKWAGLFICALIVVLSAGIGIGRFTALRGGAVVRTEGRALALSALELAPAAGGFAHSDGWKININTASMGQLCELPGIGEAMSARIIDYRSQNGDFESIEEIMAVRGIGEGIFSKIKDYITVE